MKTQIGKLNKYLFSNNFMEENFSTYFNKTVDEIQLLANNSLSIEKKILSADERIDLYQKFFLEEFKAIKDLLHDINLFVDGLTIQFEKFSEDSSSFVGKEELEELKDNVSILNFENLILRKSFKEKLFKETN